MSYTEKRAEVLRRHKLELEELEAQERRDNTTVTFQGSTLKSDISGPYTIEIVFPDNLDMKEKVRVCEFMSTALTGIFTTLGYKSRWLAPMDDYESVSNPHETKLLEIRKLLDDAFSSKPRFTAVSRYLYLIQRIVQGQEKPE